MREGVFVTLPEAAIGLLVVLGVGILSGYAVRAMEPGDTVALQRLEQAITRLTDEVQKP